MDWFQKYKMLIAGAAIAAGAAFLFLTAQDREQGVPGVPEVPEAAAISSAGIPAAENDKQIKKTEDELPEKKYIVDVKGAVKKPGVYELQEGARVKDAVERAGGLHDTADRKTINLAAALADGEAVYIPAKGEEALPQPAAGIKTDTEETAAVNLNTAGLDELQTLPGIGPSKAEAILAYREENGGFSSPDELKEVSGIGDKTYEKLEDAIVVN
ncbi:helix-hairpin-helix domain-containing protein [Metabacillus mangrovi]|nr:helix-hairpin-helix domain-containing protein [Metabacillus mangrovi]